MSPPDGHSLQVFFIAGEGRRFQQQSPNLATIAENGVSGRKRRLSPHLATVAEFGLSPFPATTASSVDRA